MISDATLLEGYRHMLTSRALDDACKQRVAEGLSAWNFHSGTGQEATSVALAAGLTDDDFYLYTHRDYGGLLTRGVPLESLLADMLFRTSGTNRGFGGIMHVVDPARGIVGRNGVFGSRYGIALGLGLGLKRHSRNGCVMVSFGEAEGSRGPLYEALNVACLWQLPVVFVAVNNGFSVSARTADLFAGGDMSTLWKGFPLPVLRVDGNDFETVAASSMALYERARRGGGPSFLECQTYRIDAHIPRDTQPYRTPDEVAVWRRKDPVARLEQSLKERGLMDAAGIVAARKEAARRVSMGFEQALGAPLPNAADMGSYVYKRRESGCGA